MCAIPEIAYFAGNNYKYICTSNVKILKNQHYFFTDVIICDFAEDFCHWEVESTDEASGFFFSRVTSEDLEKIGVAGPEESHLGTMANFS